MIMMLIMREMMIIILIMMIMTMIIMISDDDNDDCVGGDGDRHEDVNGRDYYHRDSLMTMMLTMLIMSDDAYHL